MKNGFYFVVEENGDHSFAEKNDEGWELLGTEVWSTDEEMADYKALVFIDCVMDEYGELFDIKN